MPSGDKPARELLDFYLEAGADALVGEEPVDRFAAEPAPAPARSPHQVLLPPNLEIKGRASQPAAPQAPDEAAMAARAAAKSAKTLDELRAILEKFDGCALKTTATRLVFAVAHDAPPGLTGLGLAEAVREAGVDLEMAGYLVVEPQAGAAAPERHASR